MHRCAYVLGKSACELCVQCVCVCEPAIREIPISVGSQGDNEC